MNITMTSDEICELLNVTKTTLKSICARGKLSDRLVKVGYKLCSSYKIGRNNVYDLAIIKDLTWNDYQTCKNIHKDKKESHTKYTEARITTGLKENRSKVITSSNCDICNATAKRYDNMLVCDNVIAFDRTVYFLKNNNTGEWTEITKEGYSLFWSRCSTAMHHLNYNYSRFKKGEISRSTYEDTAYEIKSNIANKEGEIALKFDTYKEAENTRRILDMIKNRYTICSS